MINIHTSRCFGSLGRKSSLLAGGSRLVLLLVSYLLVQSCEAQWIRVSEETTYVPLFYVHGDSVVYEVGDSLKATTDGGTHWVATPCSDSIQREGQFYGFVVSPADFRTWFKSTITFDDQKNPYYSVSRSTDLGVHWEVRFSADPTKTSLAYSGLVCSWVNPDVLFASGGTYGHMRDVSWDGGRTWSPMLQGNPGSIYDFTVDRKDSALCFMLIDPTGCECGGYLHLFWTTDFGTSWASSTTPDKATSFGDEHLTSGFPSRGDVYFISTVNFHTSDFGATWQKIDSSIEDTFIIPELIIDPRNTQRRYAAVETKHGGSWIMMRDESGWHRFPGWDSLKHGGLPPIAFDTLTNTLWLSPTSPVGLYKYAFPPTSVGDARPMPDVDNLMLQSYPNPTHGRITVNAGLGRSQSATLTISNILGTLVAQKNVERGNSDHIEVDEVTGTLPKGMYFLTLSDGSRSTTVPFVKY